MDSLQIRTSRLARLWLIPAGLALGLTLRVYGVPGQDSDWSILGSTPLTRYRFAGSFRRFNIFTDSDAEALKSALTWEFLLIVLYVAALAGACIFFIEMYQSPWTRRLGWTLAAGAILAGILHAVANSLALWVLGEPNADVESVIASVMWVFLVLVIGSIVYAAFALGLWIVRRILAPFGAALAKWLQFILGRADSPALISQDLPVPDFENSSVRFEADMMDDGDGIIGVCSSGGGLRSAIFNLGAYQALTDFGIMRKTRYISAVSGGAYMAGGLAAVSQNLEPEQRTLNEAYAQRSPEEGYLRRNTNYLAPSFLAKLGVVARVLLGLVINLVFVAVVIGILMLPWGWSISTKYLYPDLLDNAIQQTEDAAQTVTDRTLRVATLLDGDLGLPPPGLRLQAVLVADALENLSDVYQAGYLNDLDGVLARAPNSVAALTQEGDLLTSLIFNSYTGELPYDQELISAQSQILADDSQDLVEYLRGQRQPSIPVDGGWLAIAIATAMSAILALGSVGVRRANESTRLRESLQRTSILLGSVALILLLTLFVLPWMLFQSPADLVDRGVGALVVLQSVGAAILGIGAVRTIMVKKTGLLVSFAGGVVAPIMATVAAFAFIRIGAHRENIWWWIGGCISVYLVVMAIGDLNSWSLHPWYRRRLSSAFGVYRNPRGDIEELTPTLQKLSGYRGSETTPSPIICAAVNINEPGRTPTAMNSLSFTFDCNKLGIPGLVMTSGGETTDGEARSEATGGDQGPPDQRTYRHAMVVSSVAESQVARQAQDLSLMGAVAISGAAVSPSMGKMTVRSAQALLAIANIRLGVWLPNPIWLNELFASNHGKPVHRALAAFRSPPTWRERVRASYLFKEMFGIYRLSDKFLYVTDGGHWENLGLVEMLRRQCSLIICFDAAGDGADRFKTLSEAVSIARSELGIDLGDIDPYEQQGAPTKDTEASDAPIMRARRNVSVFDFQYPSGRSGRILYCKPVVMEHSPIDVLEYQEKNPVFPAHSTLDQFFDHEQFEAYRMIGYAAGESAAAIGRHSVAMSERPIKDQA